MFPGTLKLIEDLEKKKKKKKGNSEALAHRIYFMFKGSRHAAC